MSSSVILLTYTGRRSGRRHTIPVAYAEAEGDLVVFVGQADTKVWWRNVREAASVEVRLRGRTLDCLAETVPDDAKLVALYSGRYPSAAAALTATPRTWVRIRPGPPMAARNP